MIHQHRARRISSNARVIFQIVLTTTFALLVSCDRRESIAPATHPAKVTVACLVPSVTDIIVQMDAADHLVAISTFDHDLDGVRGLPQVGDYQTTDWEQIRAIKPTVMIRQFAPQRVPAGLTERTKELGIELVNFKIDTLTEIYSAIDRVGELLGEREKAAALKVRLAGQIERVRTDVAGKPRPSVLLVYDATGESVVGSGTYLDELISDAGGVNAAKDLRQLYPTIDREMLQKLNPDVIIQLLPRATPQILDRAKLTWANQLELKAVRAGRVYVLNDWYVLLLGAHVGDMAQKFAELIHGKAAGVP